MPRAARCLCLAFFAVFLFSLNACTDVPRLSFSPAPSTQLSGYSLQGDTTGIRDPSIIRQDGIYYAFSTDVPDQPPGAMLRIKSSPDGITWSKSGSIFKAAPAWVETKVPGAAYLWAPDISFFGGQYHVYYAVSTVGSQRSVIALATNATLNPDDAAYLWVDRGEVMESQPGMDFNAIDPNILVDSDGSVWMTYGSYWTGIKQTQINSETGLTSGTRRYDLATRPGVQDDPIEGASLVHVGQYYYLFVSVDLCCQADYMTDTYKEAVGRGSTPHGPFFDAAGTAMMAGGLTVLIEGNESWKAPGGGTVYVDAAGGKTTMVFHALSVQENGNSYLWSKQIDWTTGWPVLQPWSGS